MEQASTAAASTALQYGVLGIVALTFAFAITQLFKMMRIDHAASKADVKAMEKERGQWAVEREGLRAEYERKHREMVESYEETFREERGANRMHEDLVRKEFAEFADMMERLSAESGKSRR